MKIWKRPDPTPLRDDFYEAHCTVFEGKKIAIATFRGEAAATHELLHVFSAIDARIAALLDEKRPDALILNFRELKYNWGDEMARTLSDASWRDGDEFPIAIVASDLNRVGLTSLLQDEMDCEVSTWLSDSEDGAIALLQTKLETKNA